MSAPIACIRIPALPLQLARRAAPEDESPLAVVADARKDAKLVLVNRAAHALRLSPGMRQSTAKELVPTLRVHVVSEADVQAALEELVALLQTLSPEVELDDTHAGVLYADPSGLVHIHGGATGFALAVTEALAANGLSAAVVVAFDRPTSFVVACGLGKGTFVAASPEEARARAESVRLGSLSFSTDLLRALTRLGLRFVGELIGLPADTVHARLGAEASRFVRAFASASTLPLQPRVFAAPLERGFEIEPPEADAERLVFVAKTCFTELVREARRESTSIVALRLTFSLDHAPPVATRLEPASPTYDVALLGELLRLRLSALPLVAAVKHVHVFAETTTPTREQLALFRAKRDLESARRALARVRAAFGEDAVVRAALKDAHLPEASFVFEPTLEVRAPQAKRVARAPLVRRMHRTPRPLDLEARGVVLGEVAFSLSGGWRVRDVSRDYYYAHAEDGALLLVFFDHVRKRYFVQGEVD